MILPAIARGAGLMAVALTATILTGLPEATTAVATTTTKPTTTTALPMVATVARERGTIRGIADGDTFYLNAKQPSARIRLSGIQTTEIAHQGAGRTWCHGLPAKNRLTALTMNKQVLLRSLYPSYSWDGRRLRYAFVLSAGRYVDVQRLLLREGHALWHPSEREWLYNHAYHVLADQAAIARRSGSIWDTDFCGSGPYQSAALKLWINWDADGDDNANPNGEYVVIANDSAYTVSLSGWYVRLASHATYTFPSGSAIPARGRIRLHSGRGTRTRTDHYWGNTKGIFINDLSKAMGASAYLLDPQGDFRAWFSYPCVVSCTDPLQGRLTVGAIDPAGAESVDFTLAATGGRVYLERYVAKVGYRRYRFPSGSYLDPGETLRLVMGADPGGTADRLHHFWNQPTPILGSSGGKIVVETYRTVRITCKAYGTERCP